MPTDRKSVNHAFWELGLRFQWDESVWRTLEGLPNLRAQLGYYLERQQPHLLQVYDVDFLTRIVEERLVSPTNNRIGMEAHFSV
jgi:hypothetical protein